MIVIGLTGSIGMGKSTVAAMFRDMGVPVFDADGVVHALQGQGGRLVATIEDAFPGVTADGQVDRAALGARVFGDDAALKRLEAIVYPAVADERTTFFEKHALAPVVVLDIPLLFEKGGALQVDVIVTVSAREAVQRARVLARPGMTPETFDSIRARQMPDAEKRRRADYVIDTDVPLSETRRRVAELLACLSADKGG